MEISPIYPSRSISVSRQLQIPRECPNSSCAAITGLYKRDGGLYGLIESYKAKYYCDQAGFI
jgi:hypothetical protein